MKKVAVLIGLFCCIFSSCRTENEGIEGLPFQLEKGGAWGFLSVDGDILLQPRYKTAPSCIVNDMFLLPDSNGNQMIYSSKDWDKPVVERSYACVGYFFEETTFAQETVDSPILLIDKSGKILSSINQYSQYRIALVHNFREGRALFVTEEGKYGFMDVRGKVVIPPIYDCGHDFNEGCALVGMVDKNGELGFQMIDKEGRICWPVRQERCMLDEQWTGGMLKYKDRKSGYCGYIGDEGLPVTYLPKEVCECFRFYKDMAAFQTENGMGILDKGGNVLIPAIYHDAVIVGNNRVALQMNGKYALAEGNGRLLTDFLFDSIGRCYDNGLSVVCKGSSYGWINQKGEMVSGRDFVRIIEDEQARGWIPQLFVMAKDTVKRVSEVVEEASPRQLERKSIPTITRQDWRRTMRDNPFYAEAAKVLSGNLEESDAENRRVILNYVEHFRTSYTTKDIDFLEQLFSENALIVVGAVVRTAQQMENDYLPSEQVVYNIKSKRQYLERLKQVFQTNERIDVKFSGFRIMRHPTVPDIYGVSLRQGYSSDTYSDDGYLFLLWDFRDKTAPKIHVRTWQPSMQDNQTPLPEEEIFSIRNFNLQ